MSDFEAWKKASKKRREAIVRTIADKHLRDREYQLMAGTYVK